MYDDEPLYEPQEHDELGMKVFELVKEAVSARMSDTVANLEYFQKRAAELQDALSKTRREKRTLESNHEQELTKALKEKEIEVRREMFNGFNVGDTIYYAGIKSLFNECKKCEKGKVNAKIGDEEYVINCPHCSSGRSHSYFYHPVKDTISTIQFEINKTNNWVHFWVDKGDSKKKHEEVFKTEEECKEYCDSMNNKSKK